jgi:hypothetical protein
MTSSDSNTNLTPEAIQPLESIEGFFRYLIRTNLSLKNQGLSGSKDVMRVVMDFLGKTSDSLWDKHLLQGQPFSDEEKKSILNDPLYHAACKIYEKRYELGPYFGPCRAIEDTMEGFARLWYAVPVLQQMKQAAQDAEQEAGSDGLNLSLASVGAAAEVMAKFDESIQNCVGCAAGDAFPRASGIDAVLCARELSLKDTLSPKEEELMKIIPQEEIERARGLSEEEVADLVEQQKGLVYIMDLVDLVPLADDAERLTERLHKLGYTSQPHGAVPSVERE